MDGSVYNTRGTGRGQQRAAATRILYIEEGNLFAIVRPTRTRGVSFQMRAFLRIGAIRVHRPELGLVFLAGSGKKREGFGTGRPRGSGVDSFVCGRQINQ